MVLWAIPGPSGPADALTSSGLAGGKILQDDVLGALGGRGFLENWVCYNWGEPQLWPSNSEADKPSGGTLDWDKANWYSQVSLILF